MNEAPSGQSTEWVQKNQDKEQIKCKHANKQSKIKVQINYATKTGYTTCYSIKHRKQIIYEFSAVTLNQIFMGVHGGKHSWQVNGLRQNGGLSGVLGSEKFQTEDTNMSRMRMMSSNSSTVRPHFMPRPTKIEFSHWCESVNVFWLLSGPAQTPTPGNCTVITWGSEKRP